MSLGEQRSSGLSDACGRIQVAPARAKMHRRLQRELQVAVCIARQSQGADRILRADVHPGELCIPVSCAREVRKQRFVARAIASQQSTVVT